MITDVDAPIESTQWEATKSFYSSTVPVGDSGSLKTGCYGAGTACTDARELTEESPSNHSLMQLPRSDHIRPPTRELSTDDDQSSDMDSCQPVEALIDCEDIEIEQGKCAVSIRNAFANPLSLINMDADLNAFIESKRISDAVKVLTRSFPELPSKKRAPFTGVSALTDVEREQRHKERNRENAALTRKRLKIYAEFMDKAIEELTLILSGKKEVDLEKILRVPEGRTVVERPRKKRIRAKVPSTPCLMPALVTPTHKPVSQFCRPSFEEDDCSLEPI